MKNTQTAESQPSDKSLDELPTPDIATIKKWLTDDLGRARSLLQAIHEDGNILNLIATHMHGKITNHKASQKSMHDIHE